MSPRPASVRGGVEPFHVMEVLKAVAARRLSHDDVVLLCVGQPSTPAPAPVRAAAQQALGAETLGYTEAVGTLAFRRAIAGHYREQYGLGVDPDAVVVTTGSSTMKQDRAAIGHWGSFNRGCLSSTKRTAISAPSLLKACRAEMSFGLKRPFEGDVRSHSAMLGNRPPPAQNDGNSAELHWTSSLPCCSAMARTIFFIRARKKPERYR